jgi:hypothetical protein
MNSNRISKRQEKRTKKLKGQCASILKRLNILLKPQGSSRSGQSTLGQAIDSDVFGSSSHCPLVAIGLREFNCPLNYPRCTCGKLLVEGLCTPPGIVEANASNTQCQKKKKKLNILLININSSLFQYNNTYIILNLNFS